MSINLLDPQAATVGAIARSLMPAVVFGTTIGALPDPSDVVDLAHDRFRLEVTTRQAQQAIEAVTR